MAKPRTVSTDYSLKADVALSYIPVLLAQLNADGREMLAVVMQSMRDGGYEDGFADGSRCGNQTARG